MTTVAQQRRIANGEPVVIVPAQRKLVHLPAMERKPAHVGSPVTLEEVLEAGGTPASWRTLCGERGGVFIYGSAFWTTRLPCSKCLAGEAEPEPEPPPAEEPPPRGSCMFCFNQGGDDDGSPRCPVCKRLAA